MQTSDKGRALIRAHEGLRLEAYPDAGYGWDRATIGYGHTSQAGPPAVYRGMKITAAEADAILRADLKKFEGFVTSAVHVPLNQNQFDALVSFTFNLGPGNLRSSTLLRKLNSGDYAGAAAEFPKWNKSNGKVKPGLVKRRADEQALFRSPVAPAPRPVPKPVDAFNAGVKTVLPEVPLATYVVLGAAAAVAAAFVFFGG